MRHLHRSAIAVLLGLALTGTSPAWGEETGAAASPPGAGGDSLMSRIDFGNAYVMGQTIQSGAVYLLNRKHSQIQSMLRTRTEFRQEIRDDAEVIEGRRE